MLKTKYAIFALIFIFLCGLAAGAAIAPVIVHKIAGNPYSREKVSERIFNANMLKDAGLSANQKELVKGLVAQYVDEYRELKNNFFIERSKLYNVFCESLQTVLTPAQYEYFKVKADKELANHRKYHDKMEKDASKEEKIDTAKFMKEIEGQKKLKEEMEYYDSLLAEKYGKE